jgi:hypothetical protein
VSVDDAEITGVCPECKYLYTESVHPFPSDSLPACPKCGTKRRPYPVGVAGLPPPPDLIPLAPETAFLSANTNLLLLLVRDRGYKLGAWIGYVPVAIENVLSREFAVGDDSGRGGRVAIAPNEIEAAWEVGDRPGHHG